MPQQKFRFQYTTPAPQGDPWPNLPGEPHCKEPGKPYSPRSIQAAVKTHCNSSFLEVRHADMCVRGYRESTHDGALTPPPSRTPSPHDNLPKACGPKAR